MPDREKVTGHLNDCLMASRADNTWVFVRKDIVVDAIALLKEQEEVIKTLSAFARADGIDVDALLGRSVK